MSLYDKTLCSGAGGCGHPRHEHNGMHLEGSRTACRRRIANGRGTCACRQFKEVQGSSPVSRKLVEASSG